MPDNLIELLNRVKGNDLSDAFHASRQLGLLIERHRQNRYQDLSYESLLSSEDLNELRLTDRVVEQLTAELFSVFETYKDRASLAVWPLGKTFNKSVVDRLLKFLERNWAENDVVSSEILMTVYDDALLKNYSGLLEKIAKGGGEESRRLARQRLQLGTT